MSLIPLKLRQAADFFDQPPPPTVPPPAGSLTGLMRDAAAEIERLQAALKTWEEGCAFKGNCYLARKIEIIADEQSDDKTK